MNKKIKWILWISIALLAVCLIRWPLPYHKTVQAVKLDAQGKELGTVQIRLEGTRWISLLLADRLKVTLGPIDDFPSTKVDTDTFKQQITEEFLSHSFGIVSTNFSSDDPSHSYAYHLHVSPDLDRWMIHIVVDNAEEFYYIGCVSGEASTQELLNYFEPYAP